MSCDSVSITIAFISDNFSSVMIWSNLCSDLSPKENASCCQHEMLAQMYGVKSLNLWSAKCEAPKQIVSFRYFRQNVIIKGFAK